MLELHFISVSDVVQFQALLRVKYNTKIISKLLLKILGYLTCNAGIGVG